MDVRFADLKATMTLMSRRCMDGQIKVGNDLNKTVYYAAVAELADAWDLKSHSSIGVRVRFPSAAFRNRYQTLEI